MKVVHVTTRYPPGPGGVERHVFEVVTRLRARGIDASVLTTDLLTEIPWARLPKEVTSERRTADGIPIHRHRARALADDLHYPLLPGLASDLLEARPDLVHVHTYGTYQGFSALFAERMRGIPYVLTAHYHPTWSIWGGSGRKRLRSVYDRFLAGPVVGHAARLIVQTREEERLVREVVPQVPPVVIIPPGHTPLPEPGPAELAEWQSRDPYFLFVGRLASNKGLLPLVRALAELAPPRPALLVVGEDGGTRSELTREIKRLGLEDRVVLTGFLKEERRLAAAYRGARALILPSEYEAFGLVLVDALAQGTPVVASRVGGIPEVVDDGKDGFLIDAGDVPALAGRLRWMLDHPVDARRMGEHGRTVTAPRFTWDRLVDRLVPLYEEVLAHRGAG